MTRAAWSCRHQACWASASGQLGATAPAGQIAMQAPHPLQSSATIAGSGGAPMRGRKAIAPCPQTSPHEPHTTPRAARHAVSMPAMCLNAVGPSRVKTGAVQASAHLPQKVHSPRRKFSTGRCLGSQSMIPSGQASRHAPQPVQDDAIDASSVRGGRTGWFRAVPTRPVRNRRRERLGLGMQPEPLNIPAALEGRRFADTSRRRSHTPQPHQPPRPAK